MTWYDDLQPRERRRATFDELRAQILAVLVDEDWIAPSTVCARLNLGGADWYRVALTLERLANDGRTELRVTGRIRRFRLRRTA